MLPASRYLSVFPAFIEILEKGFGGPLRKVPEMLVDNVILARAGVSSESRQCCAEFSLLKGLVKFGVCFSTVGSVVCRCGYLWISAQLLLNLSKDVLFRSGVVVYEPAEVLALLRPCRAVIEESAKDVPGFRCA